MKKSKLILGTVQFGLDYGINNSCGKPSEDLVHDILNKAFQSGISMLDTAEVYGDSQERIGAYIKETGNKFDIITKYSPNRKDLPHDITERVLYNIRILNVDYLHAYMFHSFSNFSTYFLESKKSLERLKEKGLVKKIGVSVHSNEEIEELLRYPEIDIIQIPFNLFDNENQRQVILEKVKIRGIEVHTRSVFLQGLFFKDFNLLGKYYDPLILYLRKIHDICTEDYNINDLALNYTYSKSYIDKVLIGVDNVEQLNLNLNSIKKGISKNLLNEIATINIDNKAILNPANW